MNSAVSVDAMGRNLPSKAADYRRPGNSKLAALTALYGLTLRQYLHGKRWMVLAALFLLPAGLALLMRSTAHNVPSGALEFLLLFMFVPQAILPLVALLY